LDGRIERLKEDFGVIYSNNKELKKENEERKEDIGNLQALAQGSIEHIHKLEAATNGHSIENIATIMKAAIVEWIEGEAITDELVRANGGRIPCEVLNRSEGWEDDILLMVCRDKMNPFICKESNRAFCRIKASDLQENSND